MKKNVHPTLKITSVLEYCVFGESISQETDGRYLNEVQIGLLARFPRMDLD